MNMARCNDADGAVLKTAIFENKLNFPALFVMLD